VAYLQFVTTFSMKFGSRKNRIFFLGHQSSFVTKNDLLQPVTCTTAFFNLMPHMSLTDFVVFPPGHGRSVTDFSGWDAHEARLRCLVDVSGDIGGCSARRALKPNFN